MEKWRKIWKPRKNKGKLSPIWKKPGNTVLSLWGVAISISISISIYIYIQYIYIYSIYIYIYRVWIFTVKHEYRIGCNWIYHQQCDGEIIFFFCGEDCKRWDLGPGGSFGRTHLSTMIGSVQVLYIIYHWLVVWNMNFIFPYIGNVITNIFFRGVGQPPTR